MVREQLADNVYFNSIIDDKFKNNSLTVKFILPLTLSTVSKYAVVPYLLSMGDEEYNNIVKLNKRLYTLYGADLLVDVKKVGEYQILSISIIFIDNKFVIYNENVIESCSNLLMSILIKPYFVNKLFDDSNVKIAKNSLINDIDSLFNNKGLYAINRCKELMFEDSNLKLNPYGYKKDIISLSNEDITKAYYDVLSKSKIEFIYVGCSGVDSVKDICKRFFQYRDNKCDFMIDFKPLTINREVSFKQEIMEIIQSKLVLGFKFNSFTITPQKSRAMIVMNSIYGATPFSKLFVNVREKMSLCYSCNSTCDRFSKSMIVFMGIESKNKDKAVEESLKQLEEIKHGNFSSKDLDNVKLIIKNSLLKTKDSVINLTDWYFKHHMFGLNNTIDEELSLIEKVSKEDVVKLATELNLDIIYLLKGENVNCCQ